MLDPIEQLGNWWVIVAVSALFLFTYAVVRSLFMLRYIEVMEARAERVALAESQAEEAARIVGEAEQDSRELLDSAHARAEQLLHDAQAEAERYKRETVDAAMSEVSRHLDEGRSRIKAAREKQTRALKQEAAECVSTACSKLVGSVDSQVVDAAVDKLVARRLH